MSRDRSGNVQLDVEVALHRSNGEYYFTRKVGFFGSMRDIDPANEDLKIFGPNTPKLARFRQRTAHGSAWVFGLKGRY